MLDGPELAHILLKRIWVVIPLMIIGAIAGAAYSDARPKTFQTSQSVLVTGQVTNPLVLEDANLSQDPSQVVQTQVDILSSASLLAEVKHKIHNRDVTIAVNSSATTSDLIDVIATADSRLLATTALRTTVNYYLALLRKEQNSQLGSAEDVLRAQVDRDKASLASAPPSESSLLRQQVSQLTGTLDQLAAASSLGSTQVQLVGGPHLSPPTVSPSKAQAALIGAVIGLILAATLAVTIRRPKSRIRTQAEVTSAFEGSER